MILTIWSSTHLSQSCWFAFVPEWNSERPSIPSCGPWDAARKSVCSCSRLAWAPPDLCCLFRSGPTLPGSMCVLIQRPQLSFWLNGVPLATARAKPLDLGLVPAHSCSMQTLNRSLNFYYTWRKITTNLKKKKKKPWKTESWCVDGRVHFYCSSPSWSVITTKHLWGKGHQEQHGILEVSPVFES